MIRPSRRWFAALPVALVLCAVLWSPVSQPVADGTRIGSDIGQQALPPISKGTAVAQQFSANGSALSTLSFKFGTYQRKNTGTLHVLVQGMDSGGQWDELGTETISTATLEDNQLYTVSFMPPLQTARGQMVRVVLTSDSEPARAVTWWSDPNWQSAGTRLTINNREQPGGGVLEVTYIAHHAHLVTALAQVGERVSLMLRTSWRIVLLLAGVAAVVCMFALGRPLPD